MATSNSRPSWLIPAGIIGAVGLLLGVSALDQGDDDATIDVAAPATIPGTGSTAIAMPADTATEPIEVPSTEAPAAAQARTATEDEWPARRIADDPYALGDLDAPVVLVEYADFQCGFCGRWHRETFPLIKDKYIDTGLVRFEWRDLPFLGPESFTAAYASRAAGEQGQFWEFYEAIFGGDSVELTEQGVAEIAVDLGLDTDQFAADLTAQSLRSEVLENLGEASMIGFSSTPSFVVNQRAVVGAQPYEVFEQVLDEALVAVGAVEAPVRTTSP